MDAEVKSDHAMVSRNDMALQLMEDIISHIKKFNLILGMIDEDLMRIALK